ncbi:ABC transporter ATP-binding protein/permease [Corynebacterium sp. TAE3-ERU12]|uniref:ABC transporter ATP-binding protein n=1 Tax=Corynebacterium sp. TAE3-ERU12 TaxID=2849491 RepID=UPI001C436CC3|nr:ABC transporter ATP-binding protein [Corynebacterium sp. TAE3-ERU12]MBV7295615.1 ABC transporter ATP-binding protein/permease [Corynebacterium sp. TAE3-ERU12]
MSASTGADKRAAGKKSLDTLLEPVKGRILAARILAAISAILGVAPYVALVRLGEELLPAYAAGTTPDPDRVNTIVMVLIGTFLTQLAVYMVALTITHFADLKLNQVLRERIIHRISAAPLAWFSDRTSGRIRKAMQDDVKTLHQLIAHSPVEQTVATIAPLALVIYAFIVDWRLGLLSIATVPIYAAMQAWMMSNMGEKTAEMDNYLGNVSATAVEFADGISVVKAFGRVGQAHARYRTAAEKFAEFYYAWVGPMLRIGALAEAVIAIPVLLLVNLGGGTVLVRAGYVNPADVIATSLIAVVVPLSIQVIGRSMWAYQLAGNSALRITEILNGPTLPTPEHSETPSDSTVQFSGVSFAYGDNLALSDINLTLEPNTVTALVGPSGSGKSTLATMVARFQDPSEGTVSIGGADIRAIPADTLYKHVAFVLQDPQLPELSIRDNIALACTDASEEQIWQAATDAQLADDIRALPDGLDTIVGGSSRLSGGQRQRIAIARALLADAPILILDEATAATDTDCEAEIQAALNRLVVGRTVLVIGHKPESVQGADMVVHLSAGRINKVLRGAEVTPQSVAELMEVPVR